MTNKRAKNTMLCAEYMMQTLEISIEREKERERGGGVIYRLSIKDIIRFAI